MPFEDIILTYPIPILSFLLQGLALGTVLSTIFAGDAMSGVSDESDLGLNILSEDISKPMDGLQANPVLKSVSLYAQLNVAMGVICILTFLYKSGWYQTAEYAVNQD